MSEKTVKSSCMECPNRCGIIVRVKEGKIVEVKGNPGHPLNRGTLCYKGLNVLENSYYNPNRIMHPLRKVDGEWQQISWDEALETIVKRFQEVRNRYGDFSIAGGCRHIESYLASVGLTLFLRSLGCPHNIMDSTDICSGVSEVSDEITIGEGKYLLRTSMGAPDIANTKCLMGVAVNYKEAYNPIWKPFLEAKERGAKIIVVDPRRSPEADEADLWLQIKPGTDSALALGMLNVIINDRLFDKDFVDRWCVGFEKLESRVREYTPEIVEKITGIDQEDIRTAARLYATTKPAGLAVHTGATDHINGFQAARAYACLIAVTGNIDVPGGNPQFKATKGFRSNKSILKDESLRLPREIEAEALGSDKFPLWVGPDSKLVVHGHNSSILDAIIYEEPYPIKAMWIDGWNPIMSCPDSRKVATALKKLEFLVVSAYFVTPTAELGDIILPKAHSLECDEAIFARGAHKGFFIQQKCVEPPGEIWENFRPYIEITRRMVQKGFIEKSFIPWKSTQEYMEFQLKDTGVSLEELRERGTIPIPQRYRKYEEEGFSTLSGKVELYSEQLNKMGYDPLPGYKQDFENETYVPGLARKYPLLLTTRRRYYIASSVYPFWEASLRKFPEPQVDIHPEAAEKRGVRNGDWVWIETPLGKIKQKAVITNSVYPDTVDATLGWWFPKVSGPEHGCFEANVNAIMADGPRDPVMGISSVKGMRCEVRRAV